METVSIFKNDPNATHVAAGTTIFQQGDPADNMYVVRAGELDIILNGSVIETVSVGGIFGEMALVTRAPRSATVIARTDAELVPIDESGFLRYVHSAPFFAVQVLRITVERLRRMDEARAAEVG